MDARPSDVLRRHLINVQEAVAASPVPLAGQWAVVAGELPKVGPDLYVSIRDTGAVSFGRPMGRGETGKAESPTVSLTIRAPDEPTGYLKGKRLETMFFHMIGYRPEAGAPLWPPARVGNVDYIITNVMVYVPTTYLGKEENNLRALHSLNVRIAYEPLGVALP